MKLADRLVARQCRRRSAWLCEGAVHVHAFCKRLAVDAVDDGDGCMTVYVFHDGSVAIVDDVGFIETPRQRAQDQAYDAARSFNHG